MIDEDPILPQLKTYYFKKKKTHDFLRLENNLLDKPVVGPRSKFLRISDPDPAERDSATGGPGSLHLIQTCKI